MSETHQKMFLCPVCRFKRIRRPFGGDIPFWECMDCGLLFQTESKTESGQSRLYEDPQTDESARRIIDEESLRGPYYQGLAHWISECGVKVGGSLLEIGCGPGGLLAELARAGWGVEGIEPSPRLRSAAINRLDGESTVHDCRIEEAESVLKLKPYDAIIAIDVLEHLPRPDLFLQYAFSWLAPGGRLFLQTPNAGSIRRYLQGKSWEQLAPDEHLALHTRRSLQRLMESAGFSDIRIRTVSGSGTDSPLRRGAMRVLGGVLSGLDLGNGLRASACKEER